MRASPADVIEACATRRAGAEALAPIRPAPYTLHSVKRVSVLVLIAAAAGVVAAILSREDEPDPPESWSPVEPS